MQHLAAVLLAAAPAAEATHPRLFVTPERVAAVKAAAKAPGSHHAAALGALKSRVDGGDVAAYEGGNPTKYARSYAAREAALMALLSDGPAARRYADRAFDIIREVYTDPKQERFAHTGYGLSRAMMSMGLAIPYDWCYPLWTDEQRGFVRGKMIEALDLWPKYGHANFGDVRGSNWVAVCRGGELVLMLAAGEEGARANRYQYLKRQLVLHMKNGFGDLGVTQEGAGYTEYPGAFLLPAVYACESVGDDELRKVAETRPWWKMAMYTHSFQPHERKFVQTGVAHTSNYDEGWASLLLSLAPAEELPYFVWWYDRHMGRLAPGGPQDKFDSDRAGTVWSVLYYPTQVTPRDPTGVYPAGVADSHGYYFFRNRWKDSGDVLTSVMADAHHHGHAWDQPEVLALNLMAWNTRFIGGPGKKRDNDLCSSLLVDGKYNFKKATNLTGEKVHFEADTSGGYVIVGGGKLYPTFGVQDVKRHYLVRMSESVALLSTLDRIASDDEHTYTWQANLGSEQDDDGIESTSGTESGRPTFTLTGRDGFVKGWVLAPADATVKTGDPLRIETRGSSADLWVVMLVGSGRPPSARIAGEGLTTVLSIGRASIGWDAAAERITAD